MQLNVIRTFHGADRGIYPRTFTPGIQHIGDELALVALREGWAVPVENAPGRHAALFAAPRTKARTPKTIAIVASGPSLTLGDVQYAAKRADLLVINDNYRLAPNARWLYACDGDWWDYHIAEVRDVFKGELWTQDAGAAARHGLNLIPSAKRDGLSTDPTVIHQGHNSGYQAINLAYHFGATRCVLLGFNGAPVNGKRHWFGDHPPALMQTSEAGFADMRASFQTIPLQLESLGLEILNCTPGTAIEAFPVAKLKDAFK